MAPDGTDGGYVPKRGDNLDETLDTQSMIHMSFKGVLLLHTKSMYINRLCIVNYRRKPF